MLISKKLDLKEKQNVWVRLNHLFLVLLYIHSHSTPPNKEHLEMSNEENDTEAIKLTSISPE